MKHHKNMNPFITRVCLMALFALVGAPILSAQDLIWNFDETGVPVTAKDSSSNGRDGIISGKVSFVFQGLSGGAYGGFTTPDSQVLWQAGGEEYKELGRTNITLALWLKNPGHYERNTIAGVGNPGVHNRSWEIWLGKPDSAGRRTLNLSWGNWKGESQNYTAEDPVSFEPDAWYFLAMTWQQVGQEFTRECSIYLAKQGSASLGEPVFHVVVGDGVDAGPADARAFYVGGNITGWPGPESDTMFAKNFKDGYFGGIIDQVSLWLNRILTPKELNDVYLPRYNKFQPIIKSNQ